jgi:hypothetical protein
MALLSNLKALRANSCNTPIQCIDGITSAHECILQQSPVLSAQIKFQKENSQNNTLVVNWSLKSFTLLLDFMYYDEVNLTLDNIADLTNMSDYYSLNALYAKCFKYIDTVEIENWYEFAIDLTANDKYTQLMFDGIITMINSRMFDIPTHELVYPFFSKKPCTVKLYNALVKLGYNARCLLHIREFMTCTDGLLDIGVQSWRGTNLYDMMLIKDKINPMVYTKWLENEILVDNGILKKVDKGTSERSCSVDMSLQLRIQSGAYYNIYPDKYTFLKFKIEGNVVLIFEDDDKGCYGITNVSSETTSTVYYDQHINDSIIELKMLPRNNTHEFIITNDSYNKSYIISFDLDYSTSLTIYSVNTDVIITYLI